MTWYADNIYVPNTDQAASVLGSLRAVAGYVYEVCDLVGHQWPRPDVSHGLPDRGLLIVRPVGDPDRQSWYQEDILRWDCLEPTLPTSVALNPQRVSVSTGAETELPPLQFLAFLKELAVRCHSRVAFYSGCMWGGDVEFECAWVFGSENEVVYWSQYSSTSEQNLVRMTDEQESPAISTGDVLVEAMRHLGLQLPSPYFALHTRSFPWAQYRRSAKG